MADLKMMLQNLRDKSKCCKKDDFTGELYTIIHDMSIETLNMICEDGIEQLENAQTVNAEPLRHGRWIFYEQKSAYLWKCSNCKGNFEQQFSYCPHCGARMDGGSENG